MADLKDKKNDPGVNTIKFYLQDLVPLNGLKDDKKGLTKLEEYLNNIDQKSIWSLWLSIFETS